MNSPPPVPIGVAWAFCGFAWLPQLPVSKSAAGAAGRSPGLQPLTAAALPDGGVALRWCSGRFEFVGLEGEYCVAVVRSPGSPAELAVLHLPTRAVHRMAVSQALAYSPWL